MDISWTYDGYNVILSFEKEFQQQLIVIDLQMIKDIQQLDHKR